MKRLFLVSILLMCSATVVEAQVEIGVDGGLFFWTRPGADEWFELTVPAKSLRIGFLGEKATFETLVDATVWRNGDTEGYLGLTPGLNFLVGNGGAYVRVEGILFTFSSGEPMTGAGGALGIKRPISGGPIYFRVEFGYDRFFNPEQNRFRLLTGLSARLGG